MPQIYDVGALAGGNDLDLLRRNGVGRDANRHVYGRAEVGEQTEHAVVRSLLALCSWRNTLPAFDGDIDAQLTGTVLTLVRRGVRVPAANATAVFDLATGRTTLCWHGPSGSGTTTDLLVDPPLACAVSVRRRPTRTIGPETAETGAPSDMGSRS